MTPFTQATTDASHSDAQSEAYYVASTWELMKRKFARHKLAVASIVILALLYFTAVLFPGFFSTSDIYKRFSEYEFAPPQRIRIVRDGGLRRPFVYGLKVEVNPVTFRRSYADDPAQIYPVRLLPRGDEYRVLGLFTARRHLIGVDQNGTLFLFGTDHLARDMYSRTIHAARISLTIGLVGVAMSFVLGCLLGGLSGFFAGPIDMIIQRVVEFLSSLPTIPLWMALAAAVPQNWTPIQVYFTVTVILSTVGWTGLARTVRGKILQLRVEDYVMAARIAGATEVRIIRRHLLPGFMSYLIVSITLAVPGMILGETALSFIGVGLRPPAVSWGVLLQEAQNVRTIALSPWLLIPAAFVIGTVFCFNFVGDGLRDAADPYR